MARDRPRRANPERSRRQLDPNFVVVAADDLCGPVRLRHRDRRHGAGRSLRGKSFRVLVNKEATMTATVMRVRAALAIIVIGLTLSACGYNTIPTLQEQAKARWSDVQNQYQRRADLIPNLVATVQGYAKQEKDVFVEVTEARAKATSIHLDANDLTDPAKVKALQDA